MRRFARSLIGCSSSPPPPLAGAGAGPRRIPRAATPRASPSCPEIKVTVTRTHRAAGAGAVRGRRARPHGASSGASRPSGIDEALNNLPGVVVVQPLQLLAGPADLDPRVRQPLQLRRPRAQDPAGRRPADPARRPEPAHQRRLRRHRAGRGAARRQLVALRQRLRRRDLVPDRAAPRRRRSRSGCGCRAGAASGTATAFYKWQSWTSGRSRQRERHALDLPVQGRRVPAAQRRRRSGSSTPAWTTPSAAPPSARCG